MSINRITDTSLTVDPGMNTGWAVWEPGVKGPTHVGCIRPQSGSLEQKMIKMGALFAEVLEQHQIRKVFLEGVQHWGGTKSKISTKKGDLFKLSYLVGVYLATATALECEVFIILPNDWKGSMGKDVVMERIKNRLGQQYVNHVGDAVGIGLAMRGIL